jgi:hypothetical protein
LSKKEEKKGKYLGFAKVSKIVFRDWGSQFDPTANFLSQASVGYSDHISFDHCGIGVEKIFNFRRVNVLATSDDCVLGTTNDSNIPFFVHNSKVSEKKEIIFRIFCNVFYSLPL